MATFILTWNPQRWTFAEGQYERDVARTAAGKSTDDRWSVGSRTSGIEDGDCAFLLRQGRDRRGIVASGHCISDIYQDQHWDGSGGLASYADVSFETVLDPDDRLVTESLLVAVPDVPWQNLMQSGVQVPAQEEIALHRAWAEHLEALGFRSPEELPGEETYPEGAVDRVLVNRYERSRAARQSCIERWGSACTVCGIDFEQRYGRVGVDFIHVHHLLELSEVGEGYRVDPEKDLRPVCPNCHAMLHRTRPALSPAQLKRRLRPTGP